MKVLKETQVSFKTFLFLILGETQVSPMTPSYFLYRNLHTLEEGFKGNLGFLYLEEGFKGNLGFLYLEEGFKGNLGFLYLEDGVIGET